MTTVYVLSGFDAAPAVFAIDADESIHTYTEDGEFFDCLTRGDFFSYGFDLYTLEGAEAEAYLTQYGWEF